VGEWLVRIDIVEEARNFQRMMNTLNKMMENEVYVGIADDTTEREADETGITNAELLFIHTNGSPINNIPPRPVIEPAIYNDKDRLSDMMKKAAQLFMEGRDEEAIKQLQRVGMRGQNVSRKWFVDEKNGWPPNSPSVREAKIKKGSAILSR
jgi:hypothetical protein